MPKKRKAPPEEATDNEPSDDLLKELIRRLLPKVDLQTTGVKSFTKLLSNECGGVNLKHRRNFIKEALSEAINEMEENNNNDDDDDDDDDDSPPVKASAAAAPKKTGLTVQKEISPQLADFFGVKHSTLMARTDVVKGMWEYIKEHDLQNPDNKREIVLDAKMRNLFGCETFTMFVMNKYLGEHIHPFKPADLTPKPPKKKRTKASSPKPRKAGLQPPYKLSEELSDLVGTDILPRPQVVKAIWAYIRKHDLQNPKDKREILCDDKLKVIMGGNKKVTMFSLNKHVTDHLLEKVDRSEYNHDDERDSD